MLSKYRQIESADRHTLGRPSLNCPVDRMAVNTIEGKAEKGCSKLCLFVFKTDLFSSLLVLQN